MPFHRGSVSYDRFLPRGVQIPLDGAALWEAFRKNRIAESGVVTPAEPVAGWIGGRHVLDLTIGWETNGFGGSVLVAMRTDALRVPAEVRRAYAGLAEEALRAMLPEDQRARPLTRRERQELREGADRQARDEAVRGNHRQMRVTPVLWDIPGGALLAPAGGDETRTRLVHLFGETTKGTLCTASAADLAAGAQPGGRRAVDDLAAETFGVEPLDPARPTPAPSWCSHDAGAILGNEFLVWLWWCSEAGEQPVVDGHGVSVIPERILELSCAWDETGTTSIRADFPTRLREARRALASGKWPRRMGIMIDVAGDAYRATVRGESLAVSGLAIPRDEEDAPAGERAATERRLDKVLTFERALRGLYEHFVSLRLSPGWGAASREIARWAHRDAPRAQAVVVA